jgi:hypothetical protein
MDATFGLRIRSFDGRLQLCNGMLQLYVQGLRMYIMLFSKILSETLLKPRVHSKMEWHNTLGTLDLGRETKVYSAACLAMLCMSDDCHDAFRLRSRVRLGWATHPGALSRAPASAKGEQRHGVIPIEEVLC